MKHEIDMGESIVVFVGFLLMFWATDQTGPTGWGIVAVVMIAIIVVFGIRLLRNSEKYDTHHTVGEGAFARRR